MIPQIKEVNFGPNTANDYATLHQATVNLSTMGDRTITTQVRIDGNVVPDFTGWELEFRGERFILPTKEPQARKDTSTKNSLIDLTFYSWPVYELKRYFFVEMSSTTSGTAIADKYDASLALNLENFVDAFNLVLDHYFNGKIQISLFGQGQGIYSTDPVFFEINYTKLWEVLQKVYEMYNVRWWFDYDSASGIYLIKMGYTADSIDDHDFSYGYKGGLLSFERTVQSDDLVNILLGRGGEKNLPYRYFKRTDPDNPGWTADPDAIPELANIYFDRLHDVNFRWYVRGWMTNPTPNRDRSWEQDGYVYPTYSISPDSPYYFAYQKGATDAKFNPVEYVKDDESIAAHGEVWGALDDNDDIYPTIQGVTVNPYGRIDESVAISQIETDDISAYASAAAVETTIKDMKVSLSGNNVLTHTIYSEPFTIAQGETGNVTYRPFSKETAYPNFVYYDTTRSTLVAEPLSGGSDQPGTASYDESTGLYAVSGLPAGTYRLKLNLVLRIDSPATVATGTFGIENVVLTTSAANTNAWKPTFDIWVKNLWQTTQGTNESNKDYAERVWGPILGDRLGDEAKIVFSTGAMSISQDYEFVIADYPVPDKTKTINGVPSEWKITVYKSDAEYQATGLYIPNASSAQPLAGDKFFFVGIDMPFQYVEWAEERLNQYKTDNLEGMSEISPTWTLKLDKVRINSLEDEDYGQKLADRLDAGVMIRTTDPRFTHGDILNLYIQSITWTWNEPSKGNPYIVPDVEVILADKVSAVESPISRLENDVNVISQTYVQSGDVEAVVRRVAGALFLKKTGESDSSSSPTTFSSKVTSKGFRKGGIGGAGWGLYEDNSRKFSQSSPATRADVSDEEETIESRTVLEVDRLVVREEMEVNNLVINQISARGGREIISAARIETTLVRETDSAYVCYFDQKQNSIANLFRVNDIALGQVWSADNMELRFYKMLVTAVDVNSITLAKAGRYGSGSPQEGDVIVQYGNTTDARRQYVIIRDVVGGGHDRMLSGLNSVSAEGVEYYYAGVETGDTPRWFVGDREAEYAEYKDGVLNISGRLAVTSQLEKSDGSYVALSEYLNQLQDQVDGNIQTWFNAGEPSPLKDDPTATPNYPASEWETATDKNKHLGDLYYNETTGKAYRYQLIGGNYVWGMISDEEIAEALRAAQAAAAAAATAQADADAAKARMDAWASDGVISPTEKQGIKDEIARIDSDHSNINAAYTLYGLGSPTAYNESYTAYRAQLVTLSASEPETITIPESFATNQISYYTQRTASLNAVDDAVKTGLTNLSTEIAGYNYLKRALGETTLVQGGLVLTSLIQLGQTESGTFNVYSGINGTFDQTLPDPSRSIAAWYGGPMTDHEADPTATTYAKSLFRMDGSGYLAGGMLNWGVENGQAFLNLNGEAVVGGLGGATLNDIANLMFEVVQYKSGHYAAKLKASAYYGSNLVPLDGLYAEGWMSAGGLSETSGGGGASYLHELLDVNLPSQIGDGQALVWDSSLGDNGRWTSKNVSVDLTPFERTTNKVTSISASSTDGQYPSAKAVWTALDGKMDIGGVVSDFNTESNSGNYAITPNSVNGPGISYGQALFLRTTFDTTAQLAFNYNSGSAFFRGGSGWGSLWNRWREFAFKDDLSGYLPLTGGTLNSGGTLPLVLLNPTPTDDTFIGFSNGADNIKFGLRGPYSSHGLTLVDPSNNYYKVWHAGNDGTGSGLDADLLDGKHATDIIDGVSHIISRESISHIDGTVANAKAKLKNIGTQDLAWMFSTASFLKEFDNDSAQLYGTSFYKILNIGAYDPAENYSQFLCGSMGTDPLYVIGQKNGTWSKKEIAFTDSNVASATKLQTARTIWGQSFDGTGNVSGLLTSVTGIHMTGNLMLGAGEVGPYLNKNGISIHDASNSWIADALKFDASGNASFYHNVGIGTATPAYKLDVAGDVRTTGAMNIKIPYSSSQNTYANYFKFINSEDTDVAHLMVTGVGHLGLYARRTIEFMADGTRRFIIGATSTQISEKKAGFYPEIDGTITLNSAGALSALGDGYNVGKSDKFIRATYSKIIYLTDSVYIYYDTVNNCIRTNAPIVSDSYISAGGVSTT